MVYKMQDRRTLSRNFHDMWLEGRAVGFLVDAKADSDIKAERAHDENAFLCRLLGWPVV